MQPFFSGRSAPDYHPGMLIVKTAPAADPGGAPLGIAGGPFLAGSGGLGVLALMEKAGMIRKVTRMDDSAGDPSPATSAVSGGHGLGMVATVLSTPHPRDAAKPLARASLIEFDPSQDLRALALELARDPLVESAARVPVRYMVVKASGGGAAPAAVSPPANQMWNLKKIAWAQARAGTRFEEATTVKVAVLDTGVEPNHPDLAGRVNGYVYSYAGVSEPSGERDLIGHGTHVAGTIAASINNTIGINGVCQCDLRSYKIFDDNPDYSEADDAFVYYVNPLMYRKALAACITAGIDVVNLSIGGGREPEQTERDLFRLLGEANTVVCAAMGNERQYGSPTSYPAALPGVIAVGATSIDDTVTNFSNRGAHIALVAPGAGIWSTLPTYPGQFGFDATRDAAGRRQQGQPRRRETSYDAWDGTSMATPHVTAAAALLRAKKPGLSPAKVKAALMSSADKVPGMQGAAHHPDYGAGRLNLEVLLR